MTINFVCRASKARRDGMSPIELSIIINTQRAVVTLDRRCQSQKWNATKQIVKGDKETNEYLDVVRKKCYILETELIKSERLDIDTFVHSFKNGIPQREDTLVVIYQKHNDLYLQNVVCGKVDNASYYKYCQNRLKLQEYLHTMNKKDIKLRDIIPAFIEGFQAFLLMKLKQNTANKQLKMFKKILAFAVKERHLEVNPFQITLREEKLDYDVLTKDEIIKLYK